MKQPVAQTKIVDLLNETFGSDEVIYTDSFGNSTTLEFPEFKVNTYTENGTNILGIFCRDDRYNWFLLDINGSFLAI